MEKQRQELFQELSDNLAALWRRGRHKPHLLRQRAKLDYNPAQMQLLFFVGKKEPVTIKEIAEHFETSSSAATQLVDGLVKKGILARRDDPNDRRSVQIAVSPDAKKRWQNMRHQHIEHFSMLFNGLSDSELTQLVALIKKATTTSEGSE